MPRPHLDDSQTMRTPLSRLNQLGQQIYDRSRGPKYEQLVLDLLLEQGIPVDIRTLQDTTQLNPYLIAHILHRLESQGRVRRSSP